MKTDLSKKSETFRKKNINSSQCVVVFLEHGIFVQKKEGNLIFLTFTIELNEKVANYLHIQIEK